MTTKRLTIPDVLPLVNAYVSKKGNQLGGNLAMVLSNDNILDSNIQFCLNQAEEKEDCEGVNLANLLLKLSKTQRLKICKNGQYNRHS